MKIAFATQVLLASSQEAKYEDMWPVTYEARMKEVKFLK